MPGRTTRERLRTEITDIAKVDSGMAKLVTALLFIAALGVGFFGGPVLIVVAIALDRSRPMLWWLLAALVLILATIAITFGFHVPLNDAIKAAGNPDGIDVAQVRDDFREQPTTPQPKMLHSRWSHIRLRSCLRLQTCRGAAKTD